MTGQARRSLGASLLEGITQCAGIIPRAVHPWGIFEAPWAAVWVKSFAQAACARTVAKQLEVAVSSTNANDPGAAEAAAKAVQKRRAQQKQPKQLRHQSPLSETLQTLLLGFVSRARDNEQVRQEAAAEGVYTQVRAFRLLLAFSERCALYLTGM